MSSKKFKSISFFVDGKHYSATYNMKGDST